MWIIADILIIAIVAFFVYSSLKRGFVKSIMGSVSRIATIILVFNFSAPFGAYLGESAIGDAVRSKIDDKLQIAYEQSEDDGDVQSLIDNMKLPDFISAEIAGTNTIADNVADGMREVVFNTVMKVVAGVILYIILRILFMFIIWGLGMIVRLPVIGGIDKSLGIVAGVVNAVIVVGILTLAVAFFAPSDATDSIGNTFIFKYVYYIMLQFMA